MLDRVDIKDAVNPAKKFLTQLGLTPVLTNPFNHLVMMMKNRIEDSFFLHEYLFDSKRKDHIDSLFFCSWSGEQLFTCSLAEIFTCSSTPSMSLS